MSCPSPLFDALCRLAGDRSITMMTEWEGFLPGSYTQFIIDGVDTAELSSFDRADMLRLVETGRLIEIEETRTSSTETRVFRVARP